MIRFSREHTPATKHWLIAALLSIAPAVVAGDAGHEAADGASEPIARTAYVAEYDLLRNGKTEGIATVSLSLLDDGRWELLNRVKGTQGMAAFIGFRIDERSFVRWRDGRPQTEGYSYQQKTAFRKRTRAVVVDHAADQIISHDSRDDNKAQVLALDDGVLDRQSVSLALADDLARGASGVLDYAVVGRDAIGTWRFQVGERESVDTAAGRFEAVVATRIRDDDERVTRTWFARIPTPDANGMFPVRIEQTERGEDDIVMQLRAFTDN